MYCSTVLKRSADYRSYIAVDGCKDGSDEPGALEFDWLEVQLDSFRERGMQVSQCDMSIGLCLIASSIFTGMAYRPCSTAYGSLFR
jgi:hypothetical protein